MYQRATTVTSRSSTMARTRRRARTAHPVPEWTMDPELVGRVLSGLGKTAMPGLLAKAREMGVSLPPDLANPGAEVKPEEIVPLLRGVAGHFFPLLVEK